MSKNKIPPIIKVGAYLLSYGAFIVGFWHAHLGLKNQHFFNSENGSLVIAGMILIAIFITYYFAVRGSKAGLFFYLVCALFLIVFNLNYFYPYDFKEDLVKEEAANLNQTIQRYAERGQGITSIKSEAEKDFRNLEQLRKQIFSEIKDQGGAKKIARGKIFDFNKITSKYGITEVKPSLIGVASHQKQADIVDKELEGALKNFIEVNNSEGVTDVKAKIELAYNLKQLQTKYTPVLEFIQSDTTKIDISNDKKNIENNPKNIAQISKIASELNSIIEPVNEIYKKSNSEVPFPKVEVPITELGSVGHTIPSIIQHLKSDSKEQKVGTWKNILLVLFLDLFIPLIVYTLVRKKEDETEEETSLFSLSNRRGKNIT